MAFVIKKRQSYRWTVEHALQVKQGKTELMVFDAEFKALPQSTIEKLLEQAREMKTGDVEMLTEILVGWHGLKSEDGSTFEYNEDNLKQLLEEFPGLAGSFSRAWSESVLGQVAARKN
jgi:hypothetical protein